MSYIKADNDKEQIYFDFLEDLRQSGEVNMFGSSPYLSAAFGLRKDKASATVAKWMKLHSDPERRLEKPITKSKRTARIETTMHIEEESR